jgi:thiol-disulfide isomerase/thioredoxin
MVRILTIGVALFLAALACDAETPTSKLLNELKTKRATLPAAHQEFDVTRTLTLSSGETHPSIRKLVVDIAQGKWREVSSDGSGVRIRIFNGTDLFTLEEGGDEFVRTPRRPKDEGPAPTPYSNDLEWGRATEVTRRPCGVQGRSDQCVVVEVPVKRWTDDNGPRLRALLQGKARVILDLEDGLILSVHRLESISAGRDTYQSELLYSVTREGHPGTIASGLFQLPSANLREVKELSPWNAARLGKQLGGNPAPELSAKDMNGRTVVLSALKGRTVLLDFFTTWCPPCRADAPALEKLFRKYGPQDLAVVGVSVSEEREVVESFLNQHPHSFPVLLTSENEMPRPYQVRAFPTYVVIDRQGKIAGVAEGDQGFAELRKMLKKAGMDVE